MFGLGMGHMLLLAAIALIAIGPKQLPEVARMIGRFLNDMKKVRDEFTRSITETRDNIDKPFGEPFQSSYSPPPYQVDIATERAIEATENRVIDVTNHANSNSSSQHQLSLEPTVDAHVGTHADSADDIHDAQQVVPALDEHNQIAFQFSSEVAPESTSHVTADVASTELKKETDRKDH